jgi:hypothetical protein
MVTSLTTEGHFHMAEQQGSKGTRAMNAAHKREPFKVRLPGFVSDADVGLGDVVRRATSHLGFTACRGCEQREAALNRWVTFTARRPR